MTSTFTRVFFSTIHHTHAVLLTSVLSNLTPYEHNYCLSCYLHVVLSIMGFTLMGLIVIYERKETYC